jgi:nucleotide-binding universal stress UspA family protein
MGRMNIIGTRTVVVGIDGSSNSDAALAWAVAEASDRGLGLHLFSAGVHQTHGGESFHGHPLAGDAGVDAAVACEALAAAEARLDAAVAVVGELAPGLAVTRQSSLDRAGGELVELSARSHSVVLGRGGHGPLVGAVLGSVASHVAVHALCPVVVVHASSDGATGRSGVAVGVDGSAVSALALEHAFEEASLRGVGLHVIHAWWTRATNGSVPDTRADQTTQKRLMLSEALAGWTEQYPDVEVRVSMPVGPTAPAIVEAAHGAELIVLGNRGHGTFRSLLLGSVTRSVLAHADCTVVVVRDTDRRPARPVTQGSARWTRGIAS